MNELIQNHRARVLIYVTLCVLSICSIYSVFFITDTRQIAIDNKDKIAILQQKVLTREAVAKVYVPRIERTEKIVDLLMADMKTRLKKK